MNDKKPDLLALMGTASFFAYPIISIKDPISKSKKDIVNSRYTLVRSGKFEETKKKDQLQKLVFIIMFLKTYSTINFAELLPAFKI